MQKEMECAKILRQIETAVGAAKIGLDIIDAKYNIRYIDPAWAKAYGDPAGKKCYQYFMGRKSVCPHCGVTEAFRTKKITVKEETLAEEGNRPVQVTTVPFRDAGEWLVAETNVDITAIKRAEKIMAESEIKFRRFFDDNAEMILMADPVTRKIVDCNKRAVELTGYSRKELLSFRADTLHHRTVRRQVIGTFKKMARGEKIGLEAEIVRKDGAKVSVFLTSTIFSLAGKRYLFGTFTDLSERKKAEEALRESEQKFRSIVEASPLAIYLSVGSDRKAYYINPTFTRIFGYKAKDVPTVSAWWSRAYPDRKYRKQISEEWYARTRRAVRTGTPIEPMEAVVTCKDGSTKNIIWGFTSFGNNNFAYGLDITERKKAEDALWRSESRFRHLFESNVIPVAYWNLEGRFSDANGAWCNLIGISPRQVRQGKVSWRSITPPEILHRNFAVIKEIRAKGVCKPYEKVFIRPDGSRVTALISGSMLPGSKTEGIAFALDLTEAKEAEKALSESLQRIKMISDNLSGGMVYQILRKKDGTRVFTYFSDSVRKFYGVTPQEGMRDPRLIYSRVHKEDARRIYEEEERAFRAGKTFKAEARMVNPDGSIRWSSFVSHPRKAGNGSTLWDGMEFDITERKKAEERLRSSEEMFRAIAERSKVGIGMTQGRKVMYVNKHFADMVGYRVDEIIGKNFDRFAAPPDRKRMLDSAAKHLRGLPAPERYGIKGLRKDGSLIDVEVTSGAAVDIEGVPTALAIFRDITERKKAEEALRRSENEKHTILENLTDLVVLQGRDGRMIWSNESVSRVFGKTAGQLRGKACYKEFYGKAKPCRGCPVKEAFATGKHVEREMQYPDGSTWLIKAEPIKDAAGKVINVVEIAADITIRKKAEAILRRDALQLERLVRVRSEELLRTRNELGKSKRLAGVGLLAATVAHELRSPLAAIRTAAYNIKLKSKDSRLASHLGNIDKKVMEADQIIKNLLYYSSIKPPHFEAIKFRDLIDECVGLSREFFADLNVSVKLICECGRDMEIEGDPLQLKEVFNNVVNNAYESFSGKRGEVEIRMRADDGYLNVRVRDNGRGIEPKDYNNLFEPFFTTKAKGMGLGLSICSQIVSLHNGTINIKSKPGEGTAVEVRLPLKAMVEKSQEKAP